MVDVEVSRWTVAAPLTLPRHSPAMVSNEATRPATDRPKVDRWILDTEADLTRRVE
jgi:hypothetical protein